MAGCSLDIQRRQAQALDSGRELTTSLRVPILQFREIFVVATQLSIKELFLT
jgi:hypothetical protein